jgi:hypothetical protein
MEIKKDDNLKNVGKWEKKGKYKKEWLKKDDVWKHFLYVVSNMSMEV